MIHRSAACLLLGLVLAPRAWSTEAADTANGATLEREACSACHAQRAGNANQFYTRWRRQVKTLAALRVRVRACAQTAGVRWFPEEEADVVAYLNEAFYHFR